MKSKIFLLLAIAMFVGSVHVAGSQDIVLPKGFQMLSRSESAGAIVFDLAWPAASPSWGLTKAWLIVPSGAIKVPAVLYMHMYGAGTGREEFYDEALSRASKGTAALLMSGSVPWKQSWTGDGQDAVRLGEQIDDVLIGLKLLVGQPWINAQRIAYVGHDYGAMIGAGTVKRGAGFCAYVLLAPAPRYRDWVKYFREPKGNSLDEYEKSFGQNSPVVALSADVNVPVLVQFASIDRFITSASVMDFTNQVAGNVTVETVEDAFHANISEKGQDSRLRFIDRILSAP